MKKLIFVIGVLFCSGITAVAQYNTNQNKVWAFGDKAGLDFTSGAPVPINSNIFSVEGCASVSDKDGHLLFYTEGSKVWDRTNTVMPGGDTICPFGSSSSTQGTVIVPVPTNIFGENPNQYYIFSIYGVEHMGSDTDGLKMYYSVIDMNLNGGMGDVVPGTAATFLTSSVCEKVMTIPGNNCDVWVITHKMAEPVFYAYNMSACGLNETPVVSVAGTMPGWFTYLFGVMKATNDGRKIAVMNSSASNSSTLWSGGIDYSKVGTEICDFDPATGIVSNPFRVSDNRTDSYGEFSPDGTKLYVVSSGGAGSEIFQYDITDTATLRASEHLVATAPTLGDMRLAPDGKIYFAGDMFADYLNCIASPNSAGTACDYQVGAVTLLPGTHIIIGITNLYNAPTLAMADTIYSVSDTTVCFEATENVILPSPFPSCIRWYNGSAATTDTVTEVGTYAVTSVEGCTPYKHIFNVLPMATPCIQAAVVNVSKLGLKMYPIPAVNELVIEQTQPFSRNDLVQLIDVTGRVRIMQPLSGYSTVISLHGIPIGVYTVHITDGATRTIRKLIVGK